ncbi:cytochrome c [Labedella populi]|uniref:Cytochrome c n=1 Tax=Labedella populi TaxID=2498850 RepID=A0A444QEI2_9MICO|nr:c-type cytochrome [Labedella populi]RWZ67996.1 cytochrome c [Labedella populi]
MPVTARRRLPLIALVAALAVTLTTACSSGPAPPGRSVSGDPERGRAAVLEYGCASCHSLPDVASVDDDSIAPDLHGFDDRDHIAGQIPNRAEELIAWLQDPQSIEPGTLMPDLGVTEQDAQDIAAYLYRQ